MKNQMNLSNIIKSHNTGAFYTRYVSDKQDYIIQKTSVESLVKEYSCTLYEVEFIETDTSTLRISVDERDEIRRLIIAAENKEFDFIIVYSPDRISRDENEVLKFLQMMKDVGIPVVFSGISENINYPNMVVSDEK